RQIGAHVLAPGEVGMETGPDLEQRVDIADDVQRTGGRLEDIRHQLEERALAGAVASDDRDLFTAADFEIDPAERGVLGKGAWPWLQEAEHVEEAVRGPRVQPVDLGQVRRLDD